MGYVFEGSARARLNDIVRQESMCSDASNGDRSGRHDSFFRETAKFFLSNVSKTHYLKVAGI